MELFVALLPVLAVLALRVVSPGPSFLLIAFGLSAAAPRNAYLRLKRPLDRLVGGLLAVLDVKLIGSAAP